MQMPMLLPFLGLCPTYQAIIIVEQVFICKICSHFFALSLALCVMLLSNDDTTGLTYTRCQIPDSQLGQYSIGYSEQQIAWPLNVVSVAQKAITLLYKVH